jgi:ComF family protein
MKLSDLFEGLMSSIFPPLCAACPRAGREPFCRVCAESLEPAPLFLIEGTDDARARWSYGAAVSAAVQALKYRGRPELGRSLGRALEPIAEAMRPFDAIVPVPLSRRRLFERGYNQARELARGLSGARILPFALLRSGDGREQVGLDKKARLENLRNAFVPGGDPVAGLDLILLDDVVTTGATCAAAAAALKKAGAKRVRALALARTP